MSTQHVVIAADHGGYALKQILAAYLQEKKWEVEDLGTHSSASVDYPDYARKLCETVISKQCPGILICGTGVGMSMAANKFPEIRAALCTNEYMARLTRQHNDANVLCLGERVLGQDLAKGIVDAFLTASFEGGRHQRRIDLFTPQCGQSGSTK